MDRHGPTNPPAANASPQTAAATTPGGTVVGPPRSAREQIVKWALIFLCLFNAEDLVLTLAALSRGAGESNAVMGYFFGLGLVPTLVFKIGIVTVGALLLWRYRRRDLVPIASVGVAVVYGAIVLYHVSHALAWR
jgi:hypothetical protein